MVDIAETCRCCMKHSNLVINLFEPVGEIGILVEILSQCTNLQVVKDDGMPQNVCIECADFLQRAAAFRAQACKSDEELRKVVKAEVLDIKRECDWLLGDTGNSFDNDGLDYEHFNFDQYKIKDKDKVYECDICGQVFNSEKTFRKHLNLHIKSSHHCQYCKKCYKRQSLLDSHIRKCHSTDVNVKIECSEYKCSECEVAFDDEQALADHLKTHNTQCDVCGAEFPNYKQYKTHLKLHNAKIFNCEHCPKTYTKQDHLRNHIRSKHEGFKPYVCLHCSKAFYQKCNLKEHLLIHTGETPFLCSECGKSFNSRSNLRQHVLRHSGLRPFACKLCPKSFATKGQLTAHSKTHTGEHPFKCEECGASFTTSHSLRKHQKIHLGIRPYPCDLCDKRFTNSDHLKRHRLIHTGDKPYACPLCAHAFRQSNDLNKHLRVHMGPNIYQCSLCDMKFRTQTDLKKHYPQDHFNHPQSDYILPNPKANQNITAPENNIKIDQQKDRITITFHEQDVENGLAGNITIV